MRLIGQAVRAVVVEMMGVLLVLWLLFGTALWTCGSPSPGTASLGHDLSWSGSVTGWARTAWRAAGPAPVDTSTVAAGAAIAMTNPRGT